MQTNKMNSYTTVNTCDDFMISQEYLTFVHGLRIKNIISDQNRVVSSRYRMNTREITPDEQAKLELATSVKGIIQNCQILSSWKPNI